MNAARRHEAFGAMSGWWVTAARMLALVLALALALPPAGLAEDLAFHEGRRAPDLTVGAPSGTAQQAPDPGLSCHAHCGCHLAASPCEAGLALPPAPLRPRYAWTHEAASSVFAERLSRPPRA